MMMLTKTTTARADVRTVPAALPADVALVLSAMEAAGHGGPDRRANGRRRPLRATAALRLHVSPDRPTVVYARDATGRNVGFLARDRVPLGYGGTIDLGHGPVACVVLRCTPTAGGFYDCCAAFNRLQSVYE